MLSLSKSFLVGAESESDMSYCSGAFSSSLSLDSSTRLGGLLFVLFLPELLEELLLATSILTSTELAPSCLRFICLLRLLRLVKVSEHY